MLSLSQDNSTVLDVAAAVAVVLWGLGFCSQGSELQQVSIRDREGVAWGIGSWEGWGLGGILRNYCYFTFALPFGDLWTIAIISSSGTMPKPFWNHFETIVKAFGTTRHHFGATGHYL